MQTIVTDDRSVCLSVCHVAQLGWLHCKKTTERIKIRFGVNILGGTMNIVLVEGFDPSQRGKGKRVVVKALWPLVLSTDKNRQQLSFSRISLRVKLKGVLKVSRPKT